MQRKCSGYSLNVFQITPVLYIVVQKPLKVLDLNKPANNIKNSLGKEIKQFLANT